MKKLIEPIKLIYLPKLYKDKAITLAATTDGLDTIVSWSGRKWEIDAEINYSSFAGLPTMTDEEMEIMGIRILDHVYLSDLQHVNRLRLTVEKMQKDGIEIISDELLDLYETSKKTENEMTYRLDVNMQICKLRKKQNETFDNPLKIYDEANKVETSLMKQQLKNIVKKNN